MVYIQGRFLSSIYINCVLFIGGSLDAYGPIPEPVLGRIVVAVSPLAAKLIITSARCSTAVGCQRLEILVESKNNAPRCLLRNPK